MKLFVFLIFFMCIIQIFTLKNFLQSQNSLSSRTLDHLTSNMENKNKIDDGTENFANGNKDEVEDKQKGLSNGLILYQGIRTLNVETN